VSAGPRRPVMTLSKELHQVVVGHEWPRDAYGVAVPVLERLTNDRRSLKTAGTDHRDAHCLLDAAGVRQVDPIHLLAGVVHPPPSPEVVEGRGAEEQEVAEG